MLLAVRGKVLAVDALEITGLVTPLQGKAHGMTEVYLAERQSDGLSVVVKVLNMHAKNAPDQLARFIQE